MTIFECDRCHKQFNNIKTLHRVDMKIHNWMNVGKYWKEICVGGGEICTSCVNEMNALFNDFMKGVNPDVKTESNAGNGD